MKKNILFCSALITTAVAAAPFCHWDFEKTDAQKRYVYSTNGKYRIYTGTVPGFKGNGVLLDSKRRVNISFPVASEWKSFTFEMKFSLADGINPKTGNALICFAKHSWNRSQFVLKITPKSQLEASFTQEARKNELVLTSKVLKITPKKFHTVRVASQDEGAMKIWLDGELVAIREKGSWGFNRLVRKSPQGYPLLTFGNDLCNITTVYRALNGVMDDVKIWNKFKEPDLIADAPVATINVQ